MRAEFQAASGEMDSILFILMLSCLGLVAAWYVGNEMRGAQGGWGLLGVARAPDEDENPDAPKYAEKEPRTALGRRLFKRQAVTQGAGEKPSGAYKAKPSTGRFREKERGGYVSRAELPRYGEKPDARGPDKTPPRGERPKD